MPVARKYELHVFKEDPKCIRIPRPGLNVVGLPGSPFGPIADVLVVDLMSLILR